MSAHSTPTPVAPTSTYRLQLRPEFTLHDAAELLGQLDRLGAGAVYLSPILTAAPGSDHGYDVVDPTRVSEVLGGDTARTALAAKAHRLGLDVIADIVPNHMSVAQPAANPWWWGLLQHGRDSVYARCFDVDFDAGPVLLPVLGDDGDDGAAALDELTVSDGCLAYFDKRFPLAPGTYTPGDTVEQVHRRQHYRLVSWRRADSELTYRRFFDIDELAAVRVEDPGVFDATHAEILRWAALGELDGLRVDHVDGLTDPGGYLRRLAEHFPGWIVVEKILAPGEPVPRSWPVAGTTGYDALREICGVFVDPTGEAHFTALAREQGVAVDVETIDARARHHAATTLLRAEVRRIAALLPAHPTAATAGRAEAVAELLCAFDVYRSYLPESEAAWARAVATAVERRPDLASDLTDIDRTARADPHGAVARRIQQTSGMVVAMGTENTAFYRGTRFVALNEVGGDPAEFSVSTEEFHTAAARREASYPHTMTTLSTHDTKRAEDVRARLAAVSEEAEEFTSAVRRWTERCALPEPALNLLGWQSLVGAWPIDEGRLAEYLLKAAREARLATSWTEPDAAFEDRVRAWPRRVLGDTDLAAEVAAMVESVSAAGWSNSLGQKALQLLGPGVPDLYQGTEMWELSLVDPDNRRAVDHTLRAELLTRLENGWHPPVDATGAAKLHVVRTCLHTRRDLRPSGYLPLEASGPAARHVVAFARTSAPVAAASERSPGMAAETAEATAAQRRGIHPVSGGSAAVPGRSGGARHPDVAVITTRLPLTLARAGGWGQTILPLPSGPGTWVDRLTGRTVVPERVDGLTQARLGGLLDHYPVAVLVRERHR